MRFALWRTGTAEALVEKAAAGPAPAISGQVADAPSGDLDLRALGQALTRKRGWIIVPTVLAAVLAIVAVNLTTPRYKSEARILIDGRENVFLRPNGERNEERAALDAEAVTSQVQLVLSRDLAREIIRKNKLAERPEFDPVLQGLVAAEIAAGAVRDRPRSVLDDAGRAGARCLFRPADRLRRRQIARHRRRIPVARSRSGGAVANSIADGYLVLQQNARQEQAKAASQWLSGEIDRSAQKVSEAEARVEDFRSKSSLFVGTNNTTLSNQQMGELNTQLNNARALKSDAKRRRG